MAAQPIDAICLACADPGCDFKPARFQRRPVGPKDVLIDMKYCGVCHSDLHSAANHMAGIGRPCSYPCTPGHELAGICVQVGSEVTKFKVGDQVGVGCMVDSCLDCEKCKAGDEQKCSKSISTYGAMDNGSGRAASYPAGSHTRGGYATKMVVTEAFAILIPKGYPLECAGPLMCAAITVYDPFKKFGVKPGMRVGVVGLGGLGYMGVQIAAAMGAQVTAISRGRGKEEMARKGGASTFVPSSEPQAMAAAARSLDLILDTIPNEHDWRQYHAMLAAKGKLVFLGLNVATGAALMAGKDSVRSSVIGGVPNTQEVVDLCAKHDIRPNVEVVPVTQIAEVFEKLDSSNDAGIRYVLDIVGTLNDSTLDSWKVRPPKIGPNETGMSMCRVACEAVRMKCCLTDPK